LNTYSTGQASLYSIGNDPIGQQCITYIGFKNLTFTLNALHLFYQVLPEKCKAFVSDYVCGLGCDNYGSIYADVESRLTDYEKLRLQDKTEYSTARPRSWFFTGGDLFTFDCSTRPAQLTINSAVCDRYDATPPEPSVALQRACGTIRLAIKTYTVSVTLHLAPEFDRHDLDTFLKRLYYIANSTGGGEDLMTFTNTVTELGSGSYKITVSFTGPDQLALNLAKAMEPLTNTKSLQDDLPGSTQTSYTLVTPAPPRPIVGTPAPIASLSIVLLALASAALLL